VIRAEVQRLVELGRMPSEHDPHEVEDVERFEAAIHALPDALTAEELRAVVPLFPREGDLYELGWTLLHAVERSPAWPLEDALDGDGEWVERLRRRLEPA
jgi:hypothetical protein